MCVVAFVVCVLLVVMCCFGCLLLDVGYCFVLSFVVCCLRFVVLGCRSFLGYCCVMCFALLLNGVYSRLSLGDVVCWLLVVGCLLLAVGHVLCVVCSCLVVWCLLFVACCLSFDDCCSLIVV